MKKLLVLTLCILFSAGTAVRAGEDEGSRQLAEELLEMMDIQRNIERSFDMIRKMQLAQLQQAGIDEQTLGDRQVFMDKMMDLLAGELSWEKLKEDYIQIYQDFFTVEDLRGIIRFYRSPVGQKFLEKQPELMQRSMQISQAQMMEIMPKVQALTAEFQEHIKAARETEKKDKVSAPAIPESLDEE